MLRMFGLCACFGHLPRLGPVSLHCSCHPPLLFGCCIRTFRGVTVCLSNILCIFAVGINDGSAAAAGGVDGSKDVSDVGFEFDVRDI